MIAIPQAMARQFRVSARKCCNGRARAPDPDVVIRQCKRTLTFTVHYPEVILQLTLPAQSDEEIGLVVPMSVLDLIQEVKAESVELHCKEKLKGEVRCLDQGQPRSESIQLIEPGNEHEPPRQPEEFTSMTEGFLKGLHECCSSVTRDGGRYALDRIQVRGKQGQVIGTDGKQALICGRIRFPFAEDLLLPAIPLFGLTDWQSQDVRVGRTASHLVISAGPWTVWLAILTSGKFPDVVSLVPRQSPTQVKFDLPEVMSLLKVIADLPGASEDDHPVTLDLNETATIRGRDTKTEETKEISLVHSKVEGPPARLALNRKLLARALALGCLTLHVTPGKPLAAKGEGMTFLAMPLDPDMIVSPVENATAVANSPISQSIPPVPLPQRRIDVKQPDQNGRSPNSKTDPPPSPEATDPLVAAEELRVVLADATLKAGKLVNALKSGRKEKRVLASVFAGLKLLNLNGTQP
jgi:DNA polymerase III sliding clamp (beta) subunit (PCNA family)